jgi:predicted phage-related endonuclease
MELIVRLTGAVQESNFKEYKDEMLAVIGGINTDLQTDEDFAIAEEATKTCKQAEEAIADAKKAALDQTKSIRELYEAMDEVSNKLRETRLDLSKKVKTRKDEIRAQIVIEASKTFSDTVAGLGAHPVAVSSFRMNENRLTESVKGRRLPKGRQRMKPGG